MSETQEKIDAAYAAISALCPGVEWRMGIPARPDQDPDLLISAGLRAAEQSLEEARRVIAALKAALNGIEDWAWCRLVTWGEVADIAASALAAAEKAGY